MNELNENVIYRCKCGAEMEWRIASNGTKTSAPTAGGGVYRNLAASLLEMIDANKKHRLRIRLATKAKALVVLSRKGKSRSVTLGDGKSTTYGRLDLDTGEYIARRELEGLRALLEEADVSLLNAVRTHGFETDTCSFCGRRLTNPPSKLAGYGPRCAKKHGLPWGNAIPPDIPLYGLKRVENDLNQNFTHTCACGATVAWRLTSAGITNVANFFYSHLTAALARLIEAAKTDHFRARLVTARKAAVVLTWRAPFPVVTVTDGGATTYGKLTLRTGEYVPVSELEGLPELLMEADADFIAAAGRHGRETGECSFCGRELVDPRSVFVGYGRSCAEHYGLPWGEAA